MINIPMYDKSCQKYVGSDNAAGDKRGRTRCGFDTEAGINTMDKNGKADLTGRRLLGDTNRRLRVFRRGGGRHPEN